MGEQFVLKQGVAHATAYLQADGSLRVMAGSVVALEAAASLAAGGIVARQQLIDNGVLRLRNGQLVFAFDYLFASANRAAEVVVARSVNGQLAWKHASGKQVRDFLK